MLVNVKEMLIGNEQLIKVTFLENRNKKQEGHVPQCSPELTAVS